jgi:large subunit ribosomal protein L17
MRHRKTVFKLGRTAAHRKATLASLSAALFERKHIQTTETKAKATRRMAEHLITLAKKGTSHARRIALQRLRQKNAVKILFEEVAPQYATRNGGYTRIVKLGQRSGDGAPIAIIELVGFETAAKKQKEKEAKAAEKKKKEEKKGKEQEKAQSADKAKETKGEKESKKESAKVVKKEPKKESKKDRIQEEKAEPDKKKKTSKDKKEKK